MADSKISALTSGGLVQAADNLVVARAGASLKVTPAGIPVLVYRYTVTGSDKASIDTGVDTADAGSNDWTNGDLLEIWFYCRTDQAVQIGDALLTFNNDSGSTQYIYEQIRSHGTTAPATVETAGAANIDLFVAGDSRLASVFTTNRLTIQNYAGTVGFKSFEGTGGAGQNTTNNNEVDVYGGTYRSTSAITRLKMANVSTQKFKVGSQLLIYKRLAS